MKKYEQSKRLVASGLALTFGTVIMSGVDTSSSAAGIKNVAPAKHQNPKLEICTQEYKTYWQPNGQFVLGTLSFIRFVSKQLGVTIQSVEAGKTGIANCNPGFSETVADNANTIVEVKNFSDKCLLIGFEPKKLPPPSSSTIMTNLLTICAVIPKPVVVTT
jgi:hypothetical protein